MIDRVHGSKPVRRNGWLLAALVSFCFSGLLESTVASGQTPEPGSDQVWVQPRQSKRRPEPWYAEAIQTLRGQVKSFDAERLEIFVDGQDQPTQIAAQRVIWIQPTRMESVEGPMIELYREGKYAESLVLLREILEQRPPIWRQQWITMLAANAAWKSGRSEIALELVSQLDRRPLPPLVLAQLPIAWRRGVQPADAVREARARLSDPSPAVRLVAASWLLSSPQRNQAADVLTQLAGQDRGEIATLVAPLLWRTASPPQVQESAQEWEASLDRLPLVFQRGPSRTLMDVGRAVGLTDLADRLQWAEELVPIQPTFD